MDQNTSETLLYLIRVSITLQALHLVYLFLKDYIKVKK